MTMLTAVGETYLCEECFAEFDSLVSLDQTGPGMVCPLCGSDLLRRQVSRLAPLPAYPVPPGQTSDPPRLYPWRGLKKHPPPDVIPGSDRLPRDRR